MKRFLSFALAFLMFCAMLPQLPLDALAQTYIKNASLVDGSTYSRKYADKLNNIFRGEVSLFSNTTAKFPLGKSLNNNKVYYIANGAIGGYQCYIYAQAVYYYLFGDVVYHGDGYKYWSDSKKVLTNKKTVSYDLFLKSHVGFGAYVRTTTNSNGSYNSGKGHSFIILGYDQEGITYLEGNGDGRGLVRIAVKTWDEFNKTMLTSKGRRICHIVQCSAAICEHEAFDEVGVCTVCGIEFDYERTLDADSAGSYTALEDGICLTEKPYGEAKAVSSQLEKDTKVKVLGTVTNGFGQAWYQVLLGEVTGYAPADLFRLLHYGDQNIRCDVTSPAQGATVSKTAGALKGKVTSEYSLQEVVGLLDGKIFATVTLGDENALVLEKSALSEKLNFTKLAPGGHTLEIKARDIHREELTTVCVRQFAVKGSGLNVKEPEKPVLSYATEEKGDRLTTFTWAPTENTTHYAMTIERKNTDGKWMPYEQLRYIDSGISIALPVGRYRAELRAYNANAWLPEGTDWLHTLADDVYLTVNCFHDYESVDTVDATCTGSGVRTHTCTICDFAYTQRIPTTGHDYVNGCCSACGGVAPGIVEAGACTELVSWSVDSDGILRLSGDGALEDFLPQGAPWSREDIATRICGVIVEEGVTDLGQYAFGDIQPKWICLPESLTGIAAHAFEKCAGMNHVLYAGTEQARKAIAVGENNEPLMEMPVWHYKAADDILTQLQACTVKGFYCTLCEVFLTRAEGSGQCNYLPDHTVDPTCTEKGYTVYVCPACNGTLLADHVPALGHRYAPKEVAPTLVEGGYTEYVCNACGDSYRKAYEDAKGLPEPRIAIKPDGKTGKLTLTWNHDGEADRYEIYRATSKKGKYSKADSTELAVWQDQKASIGKTYYYKVKAVCTADASLSSGYSNIVSAATKCATPVLETATNTSSGKPVLTWSKITGAKKYEVYRATSETGKFKRITTTTKTTYTDSKASAGSRYVYKIRAIASKSAGNSIYSNIAACWAKCARPSVTVKIDTVTGQPKVSWKKITGVASYEILRFADGVQVGEGISLKTTSYQDTAVEPGVSYSYKVRAIGKKADATGAYGQSKLVTATCAQPKKPTAKLDPETGKPVVTWRAVPNADGYAVYRSTSSSSRKFKILPDAEWEFTENGACFTDTTAKKGKTYYYKVVALSGKTKSIQSGYVKIKSK